MRPKLLFASILFLSTALLAGQPKRPNSREWNAIVADYTALENSRKIQPRPKDNATRKEQIEVLLDNHRKLEPTLGPFMEKVREYYERTGDPRAASLYASEKIRLGDEYLNFLSRYDRAISIYQSALAIDPENPDARARLAIAESRRYITMDGFAAVRDRSKEEEVRRLVGMPPEDWIKQVVQNKRAFSVWIYPKKDGGAAAIYFDNGIVYHTNWNAAPAQASAENGVAREGVKNE
ncbi:MAG TPA: tetratricopeptide repeat protein [Thermoanaerobaculia bacterium]|nr:tetratricopeptide repeat protein [Thermoanaerobaculia bacterium]